MEVYQRYQETHEGFAEHPKRLRKLIESVRVRDFSHQLLRHALRMIRHTPPRVLVYRSTVSNNMFV